MASEEGKQNPKQRIQYNASLTRVLTEPSSSSSSSLLNSSRFFSSVAGRTTTATSATARNSIFYGFKALYRHQKGLCVPSCRIMSTATSFPVENKEGLKLLVTAGSHAQKVVGIWLFASAAWVFSMVVLGGVIRDSSDLVEEKANALKRENLMVCQRPLFFFFGLLQRAPILHGVGLIRSGLSMTDWRFTGNLPPMSDDDWLIEFEKYKQSRV